MIPDKIAWLPRALPRLDPFSEIQP